MVFALLLAVALPMLLAAAFLLGRHLQRRHDSADPLSPVTRQHFELFQGGHWNEDAVEAAKRRFSDLLERGEVAMVEASLRPGMHYVFQVRALAEIGTEVAGRILERQLQRRLSEDQLEQAWYWIDLAGGLRAIHREESLPHLLRCADAASDVPLGHFFAAETVCFLGFAGYLQQPETPLGRAALRLLLRAIEGLRFGVQPHMVAEARLGELLESLWDHRPEVMHPLIVRIAREICRFLRRVDHARALLADDPQELEAFEWQVSRLAALEPALGEYQGEAATGLRQQLRAATRVPELLDVLQAINDLRVDAGPELLERLQRFKGAPPEPLIEAMTWSRDACVGRWLRDTISKRVDPQRRAAYRRQGQAPRRPSLPHDVPYRSLLRALRGHGCLETERLLLVAVRDWDPTYRAAAFGSLGWWEPMQRAEVQQALEDGRRDPCPDVRQAARAALARLGERAALHWFRQGLAAEDPNHLHEAIQFVAAEGLYLLWPDLDRLADADNPDVAQVAKEVLERMSEEIA